MSYTVASRGKGHVDYGKPMYGYDAINLEWKPVLVLPDGSLSINSTTVVDTGTATSGTATTLTDTTKDWETDILEGAVIGVIHGGVKYQRFITANTLDTITFSTMGVAVDAGDQYMVIKPEEPNIPLAKGVIHNTAYTTPDDFFGTALSPSVQPTLFRCQAALSVAGFLYITITRAGNTQTLTLNNGVPLEANCTYGFDNLIYDSDTVNYRYSQSCTILSFRVLEITAAT